MASNLTEYVPGEYLGKLIKLPMKASTGIGKGQMVMADTTNGRAEVAEAAANMTGHGWAVETVDNSGGAAGDRYVYVSTEPASFAMKSGDGFDEGDIGATVYAENGTTVKKTAGTNPVTMGKLRGITEDGRALIQFPLTY